MKKRKKDWGETLRSKENLKFVAANSSEMSLTEMALEMSLTISQVKSICSTQGFPYFSENAMNWKRKGYTKGTNGYAMYPHNSTYRESASVQNSMLDEGE